ncbi:MAG: hypothetical protein ABIW17_00855, partial [Marmoricola sp.]
MADRAPTRPRLRLVASRVATVLACLLVWAALVLPNRISELSPTAFLRIPLEGLVIVGLALALPARLARRAAVLVGVVLGL